jgi:hypothetical protein
MGQKTHPYGFRLGYNKPWKSRWYADRDYADLLHEDVKLRRELKERLKSAGISSIDIERAANKLVVRIYTARPGIIIGRKGAEIDKLKQEVQKRTKREVHIDIQEVHRPELDDCPAARKARGLPPRDAKSGGLGAALWLQGHQGACRGPLEWRGNRTQGVVSAREASVADPASRHRFWYGGSAHDLRRDRREVLGLSGRERPQTRVEAAERARRRGCGVEL